MKFFQVIQSFTKIPKAHAHSGIPDKKAFVKKKGEALRLARKWNGEVRLAKPATQGTAVIRISKDGLIRVVMHSMKARDLVAFINSLVDPTFAPHHIPVRVKRRKQRKPKVVAKKQKHKSRKARKSK